MKTETIKHTPGPWKVIYNTDFYEADEEDIATKYVMNIEGANGKSVYYTESGYFKPNPADVQLISAAPEMLAIVKDFLNCCELNADELEPETVALIQQAEQIIVKAQGESK